LFVSKVAIALVESHIRTLQKQVVVMARFQIVSRNLYVGKRVKKAPNLFFARQDNVLAFGVSELPKIMMSTPIGFMTINGSMMPVALQGLMNGQNLFVGKDGRWLATYVPAIYRCYPFGLARPESGEPVLAIDEESGLVTEASSGEGELLFDDENKPTPMIMGVIGNLNKIEEDQAKTQIICSVLQHYELLEPWPIKIQSSDATQTMEGLYRINEQKLNMSDAGTLIELRNTRALQLGYGQLFSMHNLQQLGTLASAHSQAPRQNLQQSGGSIDFGILEDSGSISFDNL
jgi:hypothetical protein